MLNRREFLQLSALAAISAVGQGWTYAKKPLLSFSTLGCPKWSLDKILSEAVKDGYQGFEIRGLEGVMDLTKSPAFDTSDHIATTRRKVADTGLKIINLGASTQLHHADPATRQKHLDEAKRFITLADQLQCPFVRVFPDAFPKDQERSATLDRIAKGLVELADYAKGSQVTVLLETHGDVVQSADLLGVMKAASSPKVGLLWDIFNMWAVTGEPPARAYETLRPYIRHVHIKDAKTVDGKHLYTALGLGDSPIFDGIAILKKSGYQGYYSFEWEKTWHPEIEEPEVVFPQYTTAFNQFYFSGKKPE